MTKLVVVINGHPRSGKDTAVEFLMNALIDTGVATWAMSSIDPVRELLAPVSDLSAKTEADRLLLAEIGRAVETHSDWRTRQVVQFAASMFYQAADEPAVLFVHMREPDLMRKLNAMLTEALPEVGFFTAFVDRPDAIPVTSNEADAAVTSMRYDLTIHNYGDLHRLEQVCRSLADRLLGEIAA
ncbi:MAG: hypothetical protein KIS86_06335 [Devosia sp.]|nr:hypothetical protein [Devosia sp.]